MKTKLLYMGCLMALSMIAFSGCEKDDLAGTGEYIDLGLPSGTLWRDMNEKDGDVHMFSYQEAISTFGSNLPTKEQYEELISECKWKWKDNYYKVTGPNGKYILLQAEGSVDCHDGSNFYIDSRGTYWSSESYSDPNSIVSQAWYLDFDNNNVDMTHWSQCLGHSVRLVK